jgi:WD40 repeat protein
VGNLETGKAVEKGEGHRQPMEHLAFLPDFGAIATAQASGSLRLWDPVTGVYQRSIKLDLDWIRGLSFSPDGRYVAAGRPGPGSGVLGVWETAGGRQVYKLPGHAVKHYGRFTVLSFSPDNRFLLTWGDDYYLRKWDLKTGKAVLEKRTVPTGQALPEEDEDGQISGELFDRGDFGHDDAAFTPQADQFLLLGRGGIVHCFDVASGKESRVLQLGGSGDFGSSLSVSPTGTHLAITDRQDGGLQLVVGDLALGKAIFNLAVPGTYGEARFSPDGRTVAVGGSTQVVLVEVATGKICLEIPAPSRHLAFSPDGRFVVTAMPDTTALVWDLAILAN